MQSINLLPAQLSPWLDSPTALGVLGVQAQSLYASVSRGRIRSKADPADPRRRLYNRDDVLRLANRRSGAEPAREVALRTVAWGEPVLSSAVSTIADGRLYYAGRSALQIAATGAGLEQVAALLWDTPRVDFGEIGPAVGEPVGGGLRRALLCMAAAAADGAPARDRSPAELQADAATLVASIAQAWLGHSAARAEAGSMHAQIARCWGRPGAAEAIRQALVLLADHELNASTFAARVAASTGASLAAAVLAGLSTLTGPLHGGAAADLGMLLQEARALGVADAVASRLQRGRPLPAFGHPLYPDGDPRAAALLRVVEASATFTALSAEVARATGMLPNVDFALAAMADAHGLPHDAPLAVFAIARSAGWIAHALEQGRTRALIRPRASYSGPGLDA